MLSSRCILKDIIIKGGHVITMDRKIGDLLVGDVQLRGDRIIAVGDRIESEGAEVIDASGCIVTPGLIDGHRHAWQSLLRGLATEWSLPQYMVEARAIYSACFDSEAAYLANYIGGMESLDGGITTIVDHSHLQKSPEVSDALARGLLDSGVGGFFCYALHNVADIAEGQEIDEEQIANLLTRPPDDWHYENAERIRRTHFADPKAALRFGVAMYEATPYVPAEFSEVLFAKASELKPQLITSHWNAVSKPGFYMSSLKTLCDRGAFTVPTLLSHNNFLNEEDLRLMAAAKIGHCSCPDTELGMGLGPIVARRFSELGGASSLGVDITCYVEADMLRQAHLFLQSERKEAGSVLGTLPMEVGVPSRYALELLTIEGARALSLDQEIGSLTPQKRADITVFDPRSSLVPYRADAASTLIFYANNSHVRTVVANGKVVKRDGNLHGVATDMLQARASEAADRIQARYRALPHAKFEKAWASMF